MRDDRSHGALPWPFVVESSDEDHEDLHESSVAFREVPPCRPLENLGAPHRVAIGARFIRRARTASHAPTHTHTHTLTLMNFLNYVARKAGKAGNNDPRAPSSE